MNVSCCWSAERMLFRSRANELADEFHPYDCPFPRLPKTAPLSARNPAGVDEPVVWKLTLIVVGGGAATGVTSIKSSLLFTLPLAFVIVSLPSDTVTFFVPCTNRLPLVGVPLTTS